MRDFGAPLAPGAATAAAGKAGASASAPAPLCSVSGSRSFVQAAVPADAGGRQGSVGRGGANLQSDERLLFSRSAQSFWSLSVLWIM